MISRNLPRLVLIAAAVAATAPAPAQLASDASASHRRTKPYCQPGTKKPRGCITVPREARGRPSIDPQDQPKVRHPGVVNTGGAGSGGGPDMRETGALEWASGFYGSRAWAYRSQRFVEAAYAVPAKSAAGFASPRVAIRRLRSRLHRGSPKLAPKGTLMLFEGDRINHGLGHIGLSLGGGRMLSALDQVRDTDASGTPYWHHIYVGWAYAPATWLGRLPLPPGLGPSGFDPGSVRLQAPAIDATLAGTVRLLAEAPPGPIAFSAFYSADSAHGRPAEWYAIGRATYLGDGTHALDWDTRAVPDQGSRTAGTVTIAAFAVDADGAPRGVGSYRRVSVRNAA